MSSEFNIPAPADLLETGRDELKPLLARLDEDDVYRVLMVMNAMRIAARQLGDTPSPAPTVSLAGVSGDTRHSLRSAGREALLDPAWTRAIRDSIDARLAVSNPAFLQRTRKP